MSDDNEDNVTSIEVTVRLIPKALASLEDAARLEGLSQTDTINRALVIYQYILMERQLGKRLAWYEVVPGRFFRRGRRRQVVEAFDF